MKNIDMKIINSMRGIALDSINKAGQGHIGMALGAAPITYSLIGKIMNIVKEDPQWINRDRFVLSAGHGSMSQYSIMHFMGLLTKEDMKKHKELHSKTPSHPETKQFKFVDASTGPLGQGVAMAVGMAISEKYLQKTFNTDDYKIIDHNIFALHGDGCIQEGVGLESIQLAGTLKLDNLILIHDHNNMQIDSHAYEANNTNLKAYFESQGFNTFIVDNDNVIDIVKALEAAKKSKKPSYVQIKTTIAFGTKIQGKIGSHNGIISDKDTLEFKKRLGLKSFNPFEYDSDVYVAAKELWNKKNLNKLKWDKKLEGYKQKYPKKYHKLMNIYFKREKYDLSKIKFKESGVATRNYIIPIMEYLDNNYDSILGGSADLAAATKVKFSKTINKGGKNIIYGIREFSMAAINNGIYLHSHIKTIDATFLVFADYMKPALRLGAVQEIPSVHILTHDSYQVGGDGPTHQPFDQLAMLRAMHNLEVIRPCDESEMRLAFEYGLNSKNKQVCIIGCRQPIQSFNKLNKILPIAYKISGDEEFDVSILATGSEVDLANKVSKELAKENIKTQVISVPFVQKLINNDALVCELKINKKPIYIIEASSDNIWYRLSKHNKVEMMQATTYGYSAPGPEVYELKGFNVKNIISKIKKFIK